MVLKGKSGLDNAPVKLRHPTCKCKSILMKAGNYPISAYLSADLCSGHLIL